MNDIKKLIHDDYNKNEITTNKIILTNLILDIKSNLKFNFKETYRGYLGLTFILFFGIYKKRPFIYDIKNNYIFSTKLIEKNKRIKVNFIKNPDLYVNYKDINNNITFRFTYSYGYRKINLFHDYFTKIFKKFNFSKKDDLFKNNLDDSVKKENENFKDENKNEVEYIKGIEIKLSGVKDLNKEGVFLAEKLVNDNYSKIYIQFNHILYNDTPEIFCWVYIKNKRFSLNEINLNNFLVKQGLANIYPIKLNDIYDEKIYYNYSDLIDAERLAKERGLGIWSNSRSKVTRESSILKTRFSTFFDKLKVRFNMKKWQQNILNK